MADDTADHTKAADTSPGKPAADQPDDGSRAGNILAGSQKDSDDPSEKRRDT